MGEIDGILMDLAEYRKKKVGLKFVVDERICDGFYYASSLRLLNKFCESQQLLTAQSVIIDEVLERRE